MDKEYKSKSPNIQVGTQPETHMRTHKLQEKLKPIGERYNDKEAHHAAEAARHDAIHEATLNKEQGKERRSHQAERHNKSSHHGITEADRETSFDETMDHVRKELPRSTRWFSDFIHNPRIERTSELLGNTIARPSAILAGSLTAFLSILALYSYAKYAGFTLQGSETIVAFIAGWIVGLLFDVLKSLFTKK